MARRFWCAAVRDHAAPGAGDATATVVQAVITIVLMSATQFYIQKQLSVKNMSEAALNSPMFRQQQMIMYIFPIIFAVSGIQLPLGVMYSLDCFEHLVAGLAVVGYPQ